MSYEHCAKHDRDATNGCEACIAERRDSCRHEWAQCSECDKWLLRLAWKRLAQRLWAQRRELWREVRNLESDLEHAEPYRDMYYSTITQTDHRVRLEKDRHAAELSGAKHKLWQAERRIEELEARLAQRAAAPANGSPYRSG